MDLLYTYTLSHDNTPRSYDEALAVACVQGILNRESPRLYVLSRTNERPRYWLDLLRQDNRWLAGRAISPIDSFGELIKLAGDRIKGAIIWDPEVPATVNIATTMAGQYDAVVLSPQLHQSSSLPVLHDLRRKFTGSETGSKKNDAYRWAIREFLERDLCSSKFLCLFHDSFETRAKGEIGYVVTRDWAVKNRSFVFDLSPWPDEVPEDDPSQKLGTDYETYQMILERIERSAGGKHMTEMTGFFALTKYSSEGGRKSRHEPVPTEWQTVWIISPHNIYQNTISSDCFNQSLHSQAPRKPLKQKFAKPPLPKLENKAYVAILMADYDSATPLYDFLPSHWDDAQRGASAFIWGVNPNLIDTYPDLIAYFYETASAADTFGSDASCAGYTNPSTIRKESLALFTAHNKKYFAEADMTIAPMVLDQDQPSPGVKDAFAQFAPEGMACFVDDQHGRGGKFPPPHVWKGMPVIEL
ncbi:MAG TPA: GxGYxYP domain-containing protein, partial [Tepidisphaeraceae bacterium]|nr:GxGYxYP domain-containing protein [Tepidisphaeraceae bacterium]